MQTINSKIYMQKRKNIFHNRQNTKFSFLEKFCYRKIFNPLNRLHLSLNKTLIRHEEIT